MVSVRHGEYFFNSSIRETQAGGLIQISGHPELHSELKARLAYIERSCHNNMI